MDESPAIPAIRIEMASPADLDALVAVGEALFDFPIKLDRAKEFFADPRHHLVIAWDSDNIVGMASAFIYVHPDKEPSLFINEVSVLEQYRNRGIARTMTKHLLNIGKSEACEEFWVATEESNLPARKAYVAAGGVEDAEAVVLITFDGRVIDDV